jgi:hypothetical protein
MTYAPRSIANIAQHRYYNVWMISDRAVRYRTTRNVHLLHCAIPDTLLARTDELHCMSPVLAQSCPS